MVGFRLLSWFLKRGGQGVPTIKTPLVQDGEIVEERRARKVKQLFLFLFWLKFQSGFFSRVCGAFVVKCGKSNWRSKRVDDDLSGSNVLSCCSFLFGMIFFSGQDRDAALAKINALMGTDAPTIVKIDCVLDGRVKKTLEVGCVCLELVKKRDKRKRPG
jgi:hypothetical protein